MPETRAAPNALRTAVEPRRLQILQLIWDRERTVGDIAAALPVSIAAVSQHLAKLKKAGLVSVRAEGRKRYYRASKVEMGALAVVLESFWVDRLDALAQMAKTIERGSSAEGDTAGEADRPAAGIDTPTGGDP